MHGLDRFSDLRRRDVVHESFRQINIDDGLTLQTVLHNLLDVEHLNEAWVLLATGHEKVANLLCAVLMQDL